MLLVAKIWWLLAIILILSLPSLVLHRTYLLMTSLPTFFSMVYYLSSDYIFHIMLCWEMKTNREENMKISKEVTVLECHIMEINARTDIFNFKMPIIWLWRGWPYLNSFVITDLRIIMNHSLVYLDIFVVFLKWIAYSVCCLLRCFQPWWLLRLTDFYNDAFHDYS